MGFLETLFRKQEVKETVKNFNTNSYISVEEDYKNAANKIIKEVILNKCHPNNFATYLYSAYQKQRSEKIKNALCDVMTSRADFHSILLEVFQFGLINGNRLCDYNDMFNLISKQFSLLANPLTKEQAQEYIKEIHESFDKRMDELLAETKVERFPEFQADDKIDRLIEMGLGNSSAVKSYLNKKLEHNDQIRALNENRQIYTDLMYFKQKYPHTNTLTKDAILELCKKYNLIFATSHRFIGDIPEKSIEKITSFKVDVVDDFPRYDEYVVINQHRGFIKAGELYIAGTVDQFDITGMRVENFSLVKDDPLVFYPVQREGREYWMYVEGWGIESEDDVLKNDVVN